MYAITRSKTRTLLRLVVEGQALSVDVLFVNMRGRRTCQKLDPGAFFHVLTMRFDILIEDT